MNRVGVGLSLLLSSCALVAGLDDFTKGSGAGGDGGSGGAVGGAGGLGGSGLSGGVAGDGGVGGEGGTAGAGAACADDVIISEVRTRGPQGGNDELVEILNPTSRTISLAGLSLHARTPASGFTPRWVAPVSETLAPQARLIVVGSTYTPSPGPDYVLAPSMGDDAQTVALKRGVDPNDQEIDRVLICCDTGCTDLVGATEQPGCGVDLARSLHRVPECSDGLLLPGDSTPNDPPPSTL